MSGGRVHGTPGQQIANESGLDATNVEIGVKGEIKTAEVLDQWARDRGAVVFHSQKAPGKNFDFDHIAILGGEVLYIDTKLWKSKVTFDFKPLENEKGGLPSTVVTRDGQPFGGGKVHSAWEGETLKRVLGLRRVETLLCIVSYKSRMTNEHTVPHYTCFIDDLRGFLDQYFRGATASKKDVEIEHKILMWDPNCTDNDAFAEHYYEYKKHFDIKDVRGGFSMHKRSRHQSEVKTTGFSRFIFGFLCLMMTGIMIDTPPTTTMWLVTALLIYWGVTRSIWKHVLPAIMFGLLLLSVFGAVIG